jgi:hypothetical protein
VHIAFLSTILPGLATVKSSIFHHLIGSLYVLCSDDDLDVKLGDISENLIPAESNILTHLLLSETTSVDNLEQIYLLKYIISITQRPFFRAFFYCFRFVRFRSTSIYYSYKS